jgi:hypothetical protein
MNNIYVGYSPYRNALRQAKLTETINNQPQVAAKEIVKISISPVMMMVILFVMTMLLGSLYLMNFNKVATKGYILKRLEISRQELNNQSDLRTLNLAKAKAMNQIIASGALDNMRKPGKVSFVTGDSIIAKAN